MIPSFRLDLSRTFFDAPRVSSAVDAAGQRVLMRFGAFVMTTARQSLGRSTSKHASSLPGAPPFSHLGLVKRFIRFAYGMTAGLQSVVIGPEKLSRRYDDALPRLEFGGDAERFASRAGRKKTVHYRPRPFMGPSLEKELPGFAGLWANSVK